MMGSILSHRTISAAARKAVSACNFLSPSRSGKSTLCVRRAVGNGGGAFSLLSLGASNAAGRTSGVAGKPEASPHALASLAAKNSIQGLSW